MADYAIQIKTDTNTSNNNGFDKKKPANMFMYLVQKNMVIVHIAFCYSEMYNLGLRLLFLLPA